VSGFPLIPLTIAGFPPHRAKDRNHWLQALFENPSTVVFFEAPHRIAATLHAAGTLLGVRQIMVGRELTKVHEEFLRGSARELAERLDKAAKGEFTVVVGPIGQIAKYNGGETSVPDDDVAIVFGQITDNGSKSRREAIQTTARRLGIPVRQVYAAIERVKN